MTEFPKQLFDRLAEHRNRAQKFSQQHCGHLALCERAKAIELETILIIYSSTVSPELERCEINSALGLFESGNRIAPPEISPRI